MVGFPLMFLWSSFMLFKHYKKSTNFLDFIKSYVISFRTFSTARSSGHFDISQLKLFLISLGCLLCSSLCPYYLHVARSLASYTSTGSWYIWINNGRTTLMFAYDLISLERVACEDPQAKGVEAGHAQGEETWEMFYTLNWAHKKANKMQGKAR